jgi:hypothetical protein
MTEKDDPKQESVSPPQKDDCLGFAKEVGLRSERRGQLKIFDRVSSKCRGYLKEFERTEGREAHATPSGTTGSSGTLVVIGL